MPESQEVDLPSLTTHVMRMDKWLSAHVGQQTG
jgi:hypothetical protein